MNNKNGSVVIGLLIGLVFLYVFVFFMSLGGWGYAGYRGYHRGPSFFYWGGPRYYRGPSTRLGSVGGPSHQGGGLHGGK